MKNVLRKIAVRGHGRMHLYCGPYFKFKYYLYCLLRKVKKIGINELEIKGLLSEVKGKQIKRIPESLVRKICRDKAFKKSASCLSGCYIEFLTNTKKCEIEIIIGDYVLMEHMSIQGTMGVDVYIKHDEQDEKWKGCYVPNNYLGGRIKIKLDFSNHKILTKVRVYFPIFVPVFDCNLFIDKDANFNNVRKQGTSIIFYGSSVTHGCAVSRPGLSYPVIIGRKLKCLTYNLGFSESAHGEIQMAEWIGKQRARFIVIELDYNVTIKELYERHYVFYKKIREYNKEAILLFLNRCSDKAITRNEYEERVAIIEQSIRLAQLEGDKKVQFINLTEMFEDGFEENYFVDSKHPNDVGMQKIAEIIVERINEDEKCINEDKKISTKIL